MKISPRNRGQRFEQMVDLANHTYRLKRIAHVRKTFPESKIQRDKKGTIQKHWFERSGGLDYMGTVDGRFIAFDAKSTRKNYLSVDKVSDEQYTELRRVLDFGGVSFLLVHFELHNETYLLEAEDALRWRNSTERKSIPLEWFRERQTHRIYSRNGIILDYLDPIAEELAFKTTKSYTSED